jgi:hypothetical protein
MAMHLCKRPAVVPRASVETSSDQSPAPFSASCIRPRKPVVTSSSTKSPEPTVRRRADEGATARTGTSRIESLELAKVPQMTCPWPVAAPQSEASPELNARRGEKVPLGRRDICERFGEYAPCAVLPRVVVTPTTQAPMRCRISRKSLPAEWHTCILPYRPISISLTQALGWCRYNGSSLCQFVPLPIRRMTRWLDTEESSSYDGLNPRVPYLRSQEHHGSAALTRQAPCDPSPFTARATSSFTCVRNCAACPDPGPERAHLSASSWCRGSCSTRPAAPRGSLASLRRRSKTTCGLATGNRIVMTIPPEHASSFPLL